MSGKYYMARNTTGDGFVEGQVYGPSFVDTYGDHTILDGEGDDRSVETHSDKTNLFGAALIEVPKPLTANTPTPNPFLKTVTAVVGGTHELPYGCEIELVENCGNTVYIRVSDCAMNKEDVTEFARILSEIAEHMA